jgi:hypothetical protein
MTIVFVPILIGLALALLIGLAATLLRMERDRALYPVLLMVTATYYVLFAAMSGGRSIVRELLIAAVFTLAAVIGFRRRIWIVVVAFSAHGILDSMHERAADNPGVPVWWPSFCLAFDVAAAAYLWWRLTREQPAIGPACTSPWSSAAAGAPRAGMHSPPQPTGQPPTQTAAASKIRCRRRLDGPARS